MDKQRHYNDTFRTVEIARALQTIAQDHPEAAAVLLELVDEIVGQRLRTESLRKARLELYDAIKRGESLASWRLTERQFLRV